MRSGVGGYNKFGQATPPAGQFQAIAAGHVHSLGLTVDGQIIGWGSNTAGQLDVPAGKYQAIAAGNWFSLGLTVGGQVVGWGAGGSGQASPPSGEFLSMAGGGYHGLALVAPPGPCSFGGNSSCDTDDLDALYAVFNTSVPPTEEKFDLNSDSLVDVGDLAQWLSLAATKNGHSSPYLRGDLELDRDVDLSDYNMLALLFNPSGTYGPYLWEHGNVDGDGDIDLTDYNWLTANFSPMGYDNVEVPEPSAFCLLSSGLLLLSGARRRVRASRSSLRCRNSFILLQCNGSK